MTTLGEYVIRVRQIQVPVRDSWLDYEFYNKPHSVSICTHADGDASPYPNNKCGPTVEGLGGMAFVADVHGPAFILLATYSASRGVEARVEGVSTSPGDPITAGHTWN